jgi:hypothetical protein
MFPSGGNKGLPKFRYTSFQTRQLLRPRWLIALGFDQVDLRLFIACYTDNSIGFHIDSLSRLNQFTLSDFGSSVSLSTLNICRYLEIPKTRYVVRLASSSTTGLAPARCVRLFLAHYPFKQPPPCFSHVRYVRFVS